MFLSQLDINRWFVSESILTCILGTVVVNLSNIMAIQTARLLHLWCVLKLDEQWNDRKCHNSKCIASTDRLYDTTKSCYTLYITQSHVLARNQMYASRENVTTFVMRWYIYGMLLHLQKPMAPVNVTTHHKCINGKVATYLDSQLISIDTN